MLGICSSNINPNLSKGQNSLYKVLTIEKCLCGQGSGKLPGT